MAKQKAIKSNDSNNFKFENKGDTLVGYYLKTTEEVINGTPAKKHWFQTDKGLTTVLGQANMYKQLVENECKGMSVDIIFTGQSIKLKGGKTMKVYDVFFDTEDLYQGDLPETDAKDAYEDDAEEDTLEDETPVDEVAPARSTGTRAAQPTTAKQNAVRDMLRARKS